ncbi:hypothetical protein C8A00DRAFT_34538 [Chaetomidium leptoderma]|uniref:Uncharacterized protein n=1 Tax=Chaetomidium leptoderma TaxID=669021 RepID=A0AAN6VK29_9PEZI|nr:hypothetical protein C8A00DRAFT_34538 [Chaetomidium leptoderma]
MQRKFLSQVLLATAVSAACTGRPCDPRDKVLKILLEPAVSDAARLFCAAYNAPTATETVTLTETVSDVVTQTIPGDVITVTEPFTITEAATAYSTSYYTVTTPAAETVYKRGADGTDLGPLNVLSQYPESRISSACSCIVPTAPGSQMTVTKTASGAVTETSATTVTIPGEEEVTTVTETATTTTTTTIQTSVPTYVPAPVDVCANKPHRLCCQVMSTINRLGNSICGYTPQTVGEQLGQQCIESE